MGIRVEPNSSLNFSARDSKRLRKMVIECIKANGNSGMSASGKSLSFAVEYCECNAIPYTIHAWPGAGYYLEVTQND